MFAKIIKNFCNYGLNNTLQKILCFSLVPFYARFSPSFVATRYGVKLRANWQDATFVLCRFGLYGRGLADFLTTQNTPFIFIDIGANQGLFSLLAAQNPYCTQVLAFEPVSASYALLQENIAHSEQREKIKPIQQAVSGQAGHATMRLRSGHSGAATLKRENLTGYHTQEVVETIDITGLDAQLLVQGAILIKIDVEGHEAIVLNELLKSRHLARIEAIFYELDESCTDPAAIETALRTAEFTRFKKIGGKFHYDILAQK